jgi:hypothetical protein
MFEKTCSLVLIIPNNEEMRMEEMRRKLVVNIKVLKLIFLNNEKPQRKVITGKTIARKPIVEFIRKFETYTPSMPIKL